MTGELTNWTAAAAAAAAMATAVAIEKKTVIEANVKSH